jgi:uncharacterized protein (DUF302 family)
MRDRKNKTVTGTLIEREDIPTGLDYDALVAAFEREMGRWDPITETSIIQQKATWNMVEGAFQTMAGPYGLMIFFYVDQGRLISLKDGIKRCSLYIVGNGVIAEKILSIDIRASLYVPFRVCLYDNGNPNGASIGFDRPSSFLATLHHPELTEIGLLLDKKIDGVIQAILNNHR